MRILVRRFAFYLLTAWVALTVNFFLPRLVPGNPVATAIAQASRAGLCNPNCVRAIELQFGLHSNTPMWVQYLDYWRDLLHGDLGQSWFLGNQPVTTLLGEYLPWTAALLGVSTLLSFLLGTLLGVLLGWRRGSWLDWVMPGATFFQAIPYFFLALVLLMLFGTTLHWFPIGQGYDIYGTSPGLNWPFLSSVANHAALPAATIVLASMAGWILGMRNMMVITMDEDFVLVARAKGLPSPRVVWYAARNALLPSVANFAVAISLVVAGQLLVEIVFSYPGVGYLLFQAVLSNDYPLVQGIFVVITLVVLAANLIADGVYVLIDPRARQEA
ncbi:MAG: ABC transporter permease [Candidatus Dormibacteraeota bacterium]|nr:ABC transporter permease [Candidatus Dormibacteraeota bacterium]MBO0701620.1 ABC transporter permease [Candidatus Dormibacteraeota bacterium]